MLAMSAVSGAVGLVEGLVVTLDAIAGPKLTKFVWLCFVIGVFSVGGLWTTGGARWFGRWDRKQQRDQHIST